MRATWLADVLRAANVVVVEHDGWKGRGGPLSEIRGVVLHHTATGPNASDAAVCKILIDGRTDLRGPLAQIGLDRAGRWHLIADGRCNHNGFGEWGNQSIGIEAFNDGQGETWPLIQLDQWQRGVAAICAHLHLSPDRVKGHRETDPKRKVDPRGVSLDGFRKRVASLLDPPVPPQPTPKPIIEEDDEMPWVYRDADTNAVYFVNGRKRVHIERPALDELKKAGVVPNQEPAKVKGFEALFAEV